MTGAGRCEGCFSHRCGLVRYEGSEGKTRVGWIGGGAWSVEPARSRSPHAAAKRRSTTAKQISTSERVWWAVGVRASKRRGRVGECAFAHAVSPPPANGACKLMRVVCAGVAHADRVEKLHAMGDAGDNDVIVDSVDC